MTVDYGADGWLYSDEMPDGGELFVRVDDEGRVVELYLTKDGAEITPSDLRQVPLTRMRARGGRADLWLAVARSNPPDLHVDVSGEVRRAFPYLPTGERTGGDPSRFELSPSSSEEGLTDEFLREVATAYRDAVARGLRPNVALAEQAQRPRRTVEKWVWLARKRGFLDPTRPGRVG